MEQFSQTLIVYFPYHEAPLNFDFLPVALPVLPQAPLDFDFLPVTLPVCSRRYDMIYA